MSDINKSSGPALPKENYKFLLAGLVLVVLGFILMSGGGSDDPNVFVKEELFSFRRITLAPFVVMLGFGVILFGIMKRPKVASENTKDSE